MKNAASAISVLLTSLALVSTLAGCGHTNVASTNVSRAALSTDNPIANLPAVGAGTGSGVSVTGIMDLVRTAQQAQQGFSGEINTYEKGPDGKSSSQVMDVWWKRPNTLKINIVQGDSQSTGCVVTWDGSNTLKVKPTFLPFGVSVDTTDSRVISLNKWTIKQTDVSCILTVLLDPAAQITALGKQTIDGKSVFLLGVVSGKSPTGVTKEQIGIDMTLNLPVVRIMYIGDTMAYKLVAKTFKPGTPSSTQLSM